VPKNDSYKDYVRYAEHCLNITAATSDQGSRCIQREMAAEWLRLASLKSWTTLLSPGKLTNPPQVGRHEYEGSPRGEGFMPDQIAPEYKEADRRTGPNQENTERARAGVTGHNVRYVLGFGLLAVIIAFAIVYLIYFH
jgi:hypothetical protein